MIKGSVVHRCHLLAPSSSSSSSLSSSSSKYTILRSLLKTISVSTSKDITLASTSTTSSSSVAPDSSHQINEQENNEATDDSTTTYVDGKIRRKIPEKLKEMSVRELTKHAISSGEIKYVIEKAKEESVRTNTHISQTLNSSLEYVTNVVIQRVNRIARWFGDDGKSNYMRDMSTMKRDDENEHKDITRRRFLNKSEDSVSSSKSSSTRQRNSELFRIKRAKEDAKNYRKGAEEKWLDVFRPTTLKDFMALAEGRMMSDLKDDTYPHDSPSPSSSSSGLQGKGKPLDLFRDDNPYLEVSDILVNRIMKRNGILPRWIELAQIIDEERDSLRIILSSVWDYWHYDHPHCCLNEFKKSDAWSRVFPFIEEKITAANKIVLDYNLIAPMPAQKFALMLNYELERLVQSKSSNNTTNQNINDDDDDEIQQHSTTPPSLKVM
eukprot:TRINITY_DN4023_c1_g1_i3.p1 TRINITY_DN4023_c1_g1~~TRINITY_DN4023_c1_g1_i3.p1  ORF type:complete len:437 (+),score=131.02 TRINITY_DN4023_c1_g1_i3:60-1370(+)